MAPRPPHRKLPAPCMFSSSDGKKKYTYTDQCAEDSRLRLCQQPERKHLELFYHVQREQTGAVAELCKGADASEGAGLVRCLHSECTARLSPELDEISRDLLWQCAAPQNVENFKT